MKFLNYPTDNYIVNQPFGANFNNFYKELGLPGHNGIDIRAITGTIIRAAHDGIVTMARTDYTGGLEINIVDTTGQFRTVYYHLLSFKVKVGDKVKTGDVIALADNTGKYTTGSHLHFGLKEVRKNDYGGYDVLNKENGYRGAIDPAQYWTGLTAKDTLSLTQILLQVGINIQVFLNNINKLREPRYTFNNNLAYGSKNSEIVKLQNTLRIDGFFNYKTSTGYYGAITANAVLNFQLKNGVPHDKMVGKLVGPKTRSKLNKLYS